MAKLTLKYGEISIDYEGPEEFLKEQLDGIVDAVSKLKDLAPSTTPADGKRDQSTPLGQTKLRFRQLPTSLGSKTAPI